MKELGDILKQARLHKGYTLDDIHQMTNIDTDELEKIENGRGGEISKDFFAESFLAMYSEVLDVDETYLKQTYKRSKLASTGILPEGKRTRKERNSSKIREYIDANLPMVLFAGLLIAIIVAVAVALSQNRPIRDGAINDDPQETNFHMTTESSDEAETTAESESTEAEETSEIALVLDASDDANTVYTLERLEEVPVEVVIEAAAGQETWVSLQADEDFMDQGTLSEGTTIEETLPEGTETAIIVVGNVPATVITINGEPLEIPEEENGATNTRNIIINLE